MNRRGFLKTIGAALCGAMLCTFPDLGDSAETVGNGNDRPDKMWLTFAGRPGYGESVPYQTIRFDYS